MDITPILAEGAQRITGYGAGVIKINNSSYDYPILLTPTQVEPWRNPTLDEALLEQLFPCEILLVGSGTKGEFIPPSLRALLKEKTGAGIEVMDTGAACRTYNVLLAEGRQVVALLMPV